ncbi:hypothetical protein [Novilysobacter erysipheiresistens]|uniref:Uncharacterized protein n=1 Tax=Novilysobacter erysipheiresistens TaxID=1749332 RepID=A0ABU7Z1W5_9GAMM
MKIALKAIALIISFAIAFLAGRMYQQHQLLSSGRYLTTQPLKLYSNTGAPSGVLPEGVTLYDFDGPDEFPHFLLIVGTKALNTLQPDTAKSEFSRIPAEAAVE